jgi:hypothetical protein
MVGASVGEVVEGAIVVGISGTVNTVSIKWTSPLLATASTLVKEASPLTNTAPNPILAIVRVVPSKRVFSVEVLPSSM